MQNGFTNITSSLPGGHTELAVSVVRPHDQPPSCPSILPRIRNNQVYEPDLLALALRSLDSFANGTAEIVGSMLLS